jgi:asparaginyl-tRNA synthetase
MALLEKLNFVLENNFKRVSYTEAIDILRESTPNKKEKFNYIINECRFTVRTRALFSRKHFKCGNLV